MEGISLKAARVNAGYTLKEAGRLLGKKPSTLQHIESGKIRLTAEDLYKMADLYDCPANFFLLPERSTKSKQAVNA